jgi:hypothetical protein
MGQCPIFLDSVLEKLKRVNGREEMYLCVSWHLHLL